MSVPPPTTFAEGQRKLYGIAAVVAGICFGLAVLTGGLIVVFGDWGAGLLSVQLYILAGLLAAGCINTTIVLIGLLLGGPVGRFKGEAAVGDKRVSLEANASGENQ